MEKNNKSFSLTELKQSVTQIYILGVACKPESVCPSYITHPLTES
jgi:hypothetical protein